MTQTTTPVIITGIVHPRSAGGVARWKGETLWKLVFRLEMWRDEKGILHEEDLSLFRHSEKAEAEALASRIAAYAILTLKICYTEDDKAELLEILDDPVHDEALNRRVAHLTTSDHH